MNKLINIAYKTKLDITFAIARLGKYNTNLYKRHFRVAKQVVCYLKINNISRTCLWTIPK